MYAEERFLMHVEHRNIEFVLCFTMVFEGFTTRKKLVIWCVFDLEKLIFLTLLTSIFVKKWPRELILGGPGKHIEKVTKS